MSSMCTNVKKASKYHSHIFGHANLSATYPFEAIFLDDEEKPIHPNTVYFGIRKDTTLLFGWYATAHSAIDIHTNLYSLK